MIKSQKIKVFMPIFIPGGDYCWTFDNEILPCAFFNNEGGLPKCKLFGDLSADNSGPLKDYECLELKTKEQLCS